MNVQLWPMVMSDCETVPIAFEDIVYGTIQALCILCGTISYRIISYGTIQRSEPCHTSTVGSADFSFLLRTYISQHDNGLSVHYWEWRT